MDRESFKSKKRIVIKVGTTSITYPTGKMDLRRVRELSWILTDLRNQGREVALVSSGAIALGADRLGLDRRPRDIVLKQAASAVGQAALMQVYENFFMQYSQQVAQVLLTKDVFEDEVRKNHARNTLCALFDMGVIPIINENDTVAVDELGFSENDALSAYVACLIDSDLLIILSDIDGLYDGNPNEGPGASLIRKVEKIDGSIMEMAGASGSAMGTGGMHAKVSAAAMASASGINTLIASGEEPSVLFKILAGEEVGTWFTSG